MSATVAKTKRCSKCKKRKPLAGFGRFASSRDGLNRHCRVCARALFAAYYKTPQGAAVNAWHRLNARCRSNRHYKDVRVELSRTEFLAWAVPEYTRWFAENPEVVPSVDRREATGHYELGNLRLLAWGDNARLARRNRNVHAPVGQAWCSDCRGYRPIECFHKSRNTHNGLANRCKDCVREYQRGYYAAKRQRGNKGK